MTLDVAVAIDSVSALRRFSAISNEVRVRVLGSKKRLTTVRPRSAGTFLIGLVPISFIASAVSRISEISAGIHPGDAEQVAALQALDAGGGRRVADWRVHVHAFTSADPGNSADSMTTSSTPSISCRRTCTLSLSDVGRFLPT